MGAATHLAYGFGAGNLGFVAEIAACHTFLLLVYVWYHGLDIIIELHGLRS